MLTIAGGPMQLAWMLPWRAVEAETPSSDPCRGHNHRPRWSEVSHWRASRQWHEGKERTRGTSPCQDCPCHPPSKFRVPAPSLRVLSVTEVMFESRS